METHVCPKCNGTMDEGYISWSGSGASAYISKKQTGMMRVGTQISQALACPNCGYVEMYLDPNELKPKIS
jgi:predicted nucleic-acid-binding Zn-ribbon protein